MKQTNRITHLTAAKDIIRVLGGIKRTAELTGRGYNAVCNWGNFGAFPADFYWLMSSALNERGYTAPPTLWRQITRSEDAA